jgi:hypothetical protein
MQVSISEPRVFGSSHLVTREGERLMSKDFNGRTTVLGIALAAPMLVLAAFSPALAQPATNKFSPEADKIHLVLLVWGYSDNIGGPCLNDCKAVKATLAASVEKERLVVDDFTGKNPKTGQFFTPKEVLDGIKSMKIGKNDTVFVFHSGHGEIGDRKQPEASHLLFIDNGQIGRMQIQRPIEAMQPRAIIFLTDCCSSYREFNAASDGGRQSQGGNGPNLKTVRNLMLKPVGIVSITAAEDGKLAIAASKGANPGKAGSSFTVAMLRLWYDQKVTHTNWEQFFPILKAETGKASGGVHFARAFEIMETGKIPSVTQPGAVPARNQVTWEELQLFASKRQ